MSREEIVFSKRAIVAVSVISVVASNVLIGAMAVFWLWSFSDELETKTVAAATTAAVAATEVVIRPIRDDQIRLTEANKRIDSEIGSLKDRQEKLGERLDRIRR